MAVQLGNSSFFLRLMSASVTVANHAGKIVRDIMLKGNLGIVEKEGINDLQTEADRSVQRCIVNSLLQQFPKITIIGEETLEKRECEEELLINLSDCDIINAQCPENLSSLKQEDIVVWVDPLDGTAEYTQGLLDHVTVLIGIAAKGKAVGGIINQPYFNYKKEDNTKLGRTMWGIVGVGASGINMTSPPKDTKIITTTRSHSNQLIKSTVSAMNPDEVLKVGGAGHKVLLLIEGKAHAYVFPSNGSKKWDTCAPEAILHSLGGKLTDMFGEPFKYHASVERNNSQGVLATHSSSVHASYVSSVPTEVKDLLGLKKQ